MTKKSLTKKTAQTSMEIEVFEKKYQRHIEMMTESILDTKTNINDKNYEDEYDKAYDDATYVLASEKSIKLID